MNQNPEQLARDEIDRQLLAYGYTIQNKAQINLAAGVGVAMREYRTEVGPVDCILFVNKKPVGVIEAKREEEGVRLTMHEDQSSEIASAKLKYIFNNNPLPFIYESTGELTRFTNYHDQKPHSRPTFTFRPPDTLAGWLRESEH